MNFAQLGLVDPTRLEGLREKKQRYLIDRFMLSPSINIFVGHSGLGKSALCMQLGMSVAGGVQFFGYDVVEPGPVVYCDAESTPNMMGDMEDALAYHLGLESKPKDFHIWNPTWNVNNDPVVIAQNKVQLYNIIRHVKPRLVIIDSLRNYFPLAIEKQSKASEMIREMRKIGGETQTSFLLVHHLRKTNKDERRAGERPTVRGNVNLWLEEASGTLALINNTDLRLGWEPDDNNPDYLWFGGFLRVAGTVGPLKLDRLYDNNGEAAGYNLIQPVEQLKRADRLIYNQLPWEEFPFTFITQDLGKSQGTTARFIHRALDLGLVRINRIEVSNNGGRPRKWYIKSSPDECKD